MAESTIAPEPCSAQEKFPKTPPFSEFKRILHLHLADLNNDLYARNSMYAFYHSAIQALSAQHEPAPPSTEHQFGLFLIGRYMQEEDKALLDKLCKAADWVAEVECK